MQQDSLAPYDHGLCLALEKFRFHGLDFLFNPEAQAKPLFERIPAQPWDILPGLVLAQHWPVQRVSPALLAHHGLVQRASPAMLAQHQDQSFNRLCHLRTVEAIRLPLQVSRGNGNIWHHRAVLIPNPVHRCLTRALAATT